LGEEYISFSSSLCSLLHTKLDFTVTKPVKITRDSNIRYSTFVCLYEGLVSTARELILIILYQEICIRSNLPWEACQYFLKAQETKLVEIGWSDLN